MSTLDLLAILGVVATPASIAFAVAWWSTRRELEVRRELSRYPSDRALGGDGGRLEQAVDAIAVEVERIAEGQRFVTRLLAERSAVERDVAERAQLLASPPARVITPH